jgi:hypothetical protein
MFEIRALHLLGRYSITLDTALALEFLFLYKYSEGYQIYLSDSSMCILFFPLKMLLNILPKAQ